MSQIKYQVTSLAKGDMYRCEKCGLVVAIEDPCGCVACDLICCEVPMKKVEKPKKKPAKSEVKAKEAEKKAQGQEIKPKS
jgi:hypothetical protein